MPVYGECGGLMYLSQRITDFEGKRYPMVGLVPCESIMKNRLARMGYVEIEAQQDTILSAKGTQLRGHEFHWSEMETELTLPAYRVFHPDERTEGYSNGNVLASYVHLHFGTDLNLVQNFIESCQQWASARCFLTSLNQTGYTKS
jgi:cobyrinic acid a,c-diamide synthase